jgi:hypothetical protein
VADRTRLHSIGAQREQPHRQCIDDLVRHEHAAPGLGRRRIEPFGQFLQMWTTLPQQRALAFAQIGTAFEQAIAARQRIELFELEQQLGGQRAAAGSEFEHIAAGFAQRRRQRAGEAAREDEAKFRRSDEVALRTELRRAGAVVTEPRRIQRQFHVAGEVQRAAGGGDFAANQRRQPVAVGTCVGVGFGQIGVHAR